MLEKNSFVSMIELEILDVYECEMIKLQLGAFNGLTNLK